MNKNSSVVFNEELKETAAEIRSLISKISAKRPIHLSSNLGIVEISLAVNQLLKKEPNIVLYDIGHQAYTDKIITNGEKKFEEIRTGRGQSGFYEDGFLSGHAGNALSAGLGMTYGCKGIVTVIVGDAGFMNGQSLEAINNIFATKQKMIVIINDNGMSISPTVGTQCSSQNNVFMNSSFLKNLSKNYIGIKNGNDIDFVIKSLKDAMIAVNSGPVIVHFKTQKGYGNKNVVGDKIGKFHMTYPEDKKSFSSVAGNHLRRVMSTKKDVVVVNPAMTLGTGCEELKNKYPDRYFDVGIAEGHGMTFAAGLKLGNKTPVTFYYSTFLQRAFDQILNDCVNNSTNFLCLVDRADLAAADGQTHHGIHDVGFLKNIPNSIICSPRSHYQLEQLIDVCLKTKKHCFIRYPRNYFHSESYIKQDPRVSIGEWEYIVKRKNTDSCLVTYGPYIDVLAKELKNKNIDIINAMFISGYKKNTIHNIVKKYKNIVVYERTFGGQLVNDFYKFKRQNNIYEMNYKDVPKHGSLEQLDKKSKMNVASVKKLLKSIC